MGDFTNDGPDDAVEVGCEFKTFCNKWLPYGCQKDDITLCGRRNMLNAYLESPEFNSVYLNRKDAERSIDRETLMLGEAIAGYRGMEDISVVLFSDVVRIIKTLNLPEWKCNVCGGTRTIEVRDDPSPSGIGLSPGYVLIEEPCPECGKKIVDDLIEAGQNPRDGCHYRRHIEARRKKVD